MNSCAWGAVPPGAPAGSGISKLLVDMDMKTPGRGCHALTPGGGACGSCAHITAHAAQHTGVSTAQLSAAQRITAQHAIRVYTREY
jgi:hypothetical protein